MNDFFLARYPTPEDENKAVNMDPPSVETARDRDTKHSLETSASSIDAHKADSPVVTMSFEVPASAPVTTSSTEQTNGNLTEMYSPEPLRAGEYIIGNQHISHLTPASVSRLRPNAYELDATIVSKTVTNDSFTAYQHGGASRRSSRRSHDIRDGAPSRLTTGPRPFRLGRGTPTTAIHHPNTSDANTRRSTDEGSGSDPFVGTGRPMPPYQLSPGPITSVKTTETPSPSLERLRSSQLDGTPGVLDLHDSQNEILSLLNKLQNVHITHTNSEVEAALDRCQVDLRARSKDKAIGAAEANILDREAARIGRVGSTPTKPSRETRDAALLRSLRHELTRLVQDARAALDAAAEAKSQAASSTPSSRETRAYIPYRVGEDSRVVALNSEIRELRNQVGQLHAEKEQACKDRDEARKEKSDLIRQVDRLTEEVKGYRRGYTTPWAKDWNVGSRRNE